MYAWMIRWLQPNSSVDAREQEITLYADHELQVTSTGQVENEPGSRWLYQVIRDDFRRLPAAWNRSGFAPGIAAAENPF